MSDDRGALGLEPGTVRLVKYDPRWPELFSAETRRILDAREFADLKRDLAARFPRDREAYIAGKSARVAAILTLARRE